MAETLDSSNKEVISVVLPGQDEAFLHPLSDGHYRLEATGCQAFLDLLRGLAAKNKDPKKWELPPGSGHAEILVRELIFKVRGEWQFPLEHAELCHCRAVTALTVDRAIVTGASNLEAVRRWTSANTACGTCKPEVETLLKFRRIS